jgi:hypothetical protein
MATPEDPTPQQQYENFEIIEYGEDKENTNCFHNTVFPTDSKPFKVLLL